MPAADVNVIVDNGLTVIVYVLAVPVHGDMNGVTVIVAVIGELVAFVAVKDDIFPEPDAGIPIAVLLFVQVKVAPDGVLLNAVAATVPPLHTTTFDGTVTVDGVQLFATQLPIPGAGQPEPVGVSVIATASPGLNELTV